MAAKVNTRFVVILTASLLTLFAGVAGLGYYVINKTGSTWERRGDRFAAKGEFENAAIAYGRAVGHEKNNVVWLRKWDDALSKWAPSTEAEFNEAYSKFHLTILQQIANALQTDADAHRDFLEAMFQEFSYAGGGRSESWEQMYNIANTALERLDLTRPEFQKLQRYRGLAQLYRLRNVEGSEKERTDTRKDLEAAIAVDPSDVESALGLVEWLAVDASRDRRGGNTDAADAKMKDARAALDAVIARFPKDPRPMLRRWELDAETALAGAINAAEQRKVRDQIAPALDPVIAAAKEADGQIMDAMFLRRFGQRVMAARPADGAGVWLSLVDSALAKRPGDSTLLVVRAQALSQMDEDEQAIEQFKKVIDLPDPTVTFAGKQLRENRKLSLQLLAERTLAKWERADPKDRPAIMDEAKKQRDMLADRVGSNHPAILRVNALIAVAELRFPEAVKHLSDLNNLTRGSDLETLYMLAYALRGEGSLGAAVQQYDRILQLDGGQVAALLTASEIELRLEQIEPARKRLEKVLQLDPENEVAKRQMQLVEATLNQSKEQPISDPVIRAILEANRLMTQSEPDLQGATELIEKALKANPDDYRLINLRVQMFVQRGDKDAALALVNDCLQRAPASSPLKQLRAYLVEPDPIKAQEQIIAESEVPDLDKKLMLYGLYKSNGLNSKAAPILEEVSKSAPDDTRVVEYQFVEALNDKSLDNARALAAKAAQLNIDQCNGLMFQARLEMVDQKLDAAVATLGRVTQQLPLSASAWRLLGQAQLSAGRVDLALEAFRKAVQFRPNDTSMIKPFLSALLSLGRQQEALEVVRSAKQRNAADELMTGLWLELEEAIGDKAKAREVRERLLVTRPADRRNKIALSRLLLQAKEWDKAKGVIDSLKADEPLAATLLEARMLALRDDPEAAKDLVFKHVEATPEPAMKLEALLGLAETLIEFNRDEQAFVVLREARPHQDPKLMQADRRLGDTLFERGRFEESVEAYDRILAGAPDKDAVVAKRRAEALLRLKKWADVEAAVAGIEKTIPRDLQTSLLLADAAAGKGDTRAARQHLDKAVELAPTNPMAFFRRATLNEKDADQFGLVMKDLDTANKLRPDFTQARLMKARLLFQKGRESEALAEIAAAVEATPEDDGLRLNYIAQLQRVLRGDEAKIVATEAVRARAAAQPVWYSHAGDVYSAAGDHRGALEFYRKGYEVRPAPETVGRLVDCLLRQTPMQGAEAMRAIDLYPKDQAEAARPVLMILRARVFAGTGKDADAQKTIAEVWPLVRNSPPQVRAWFDQLDEVFKRDVTKIEAFVGTVCPTPEALGPTGLVMLQSRVSRDQKRWPEVLQALAGLESKTRDGATLLDLHRTRAQIHYFSGRFEDAVVSYRAGLAISPENSEFCNNLAYTLARDLNRREEALPYAEKAALLDPSNASVLDTLGWLRLKAGEKNAADEILTRALNLATRPDERIPVLVHLAEVKALLGDRSAARDLLTEAEKLGVDNAVLMKANQAEFDAVRKMLD